MEAVCEFTTLRNLDSQTQYILIKQAKCEKASWFGGPPEVQEEGQQDRVSKVASQLHNQFMDEWLGA